LTTEIPLQDRIIVALDVEKPEQAKELVRRCESHVGFYKVGLQLFMASSGFSTSRATIIRSCKGISVVSMLSSIFFLKLD
ncbi:MAG: hypothetical protein KJ985_03555, partial [Proteobacteria bacterium]|nr:hypothetical protein [Pseudomonadota bacterium]